MNKFKSENCLNRRQRGGSSDVGVGIVAILTVGILPRLNGIPTELYFSLDRRFVPPSSWGQIRATAAPRRIAEIRAANQRRSGRVVGFARRATRVFCGTLREPQAPSVELIPAPSPRPSPRG